MIRTTIISAFAALALGSGSVSTAQDVEFAAIETKRLEKGTQALSEDKAYIFVRSATRSVGIFIKHPTDADIAAFEEEWREELEKAIEKYPRRLERWKERRTARNPGPRPVEPTEENFSIGSIETRLLVSFGPQYVFDKGKDANGDKYFDYLIEVEPGDYTYYGPMFLGPQGAAGACYCMGSVKFAVDAGKITSLGDFLSLVWADKDDFAQTTVMHQFFPDRPARAVDWSVPDSLSALPSAPAELYAAGKMNNFYRGAVQRMPPVEGVLDYERDVVIDVRAKLAAEREAAEKAAAEQAAAEEAARLRELEAQAAEAEAAAEALLETPSEEGVETSPVDETPAS